MNPLAMAATAVLGLVLAILVGLWTIVAISTIGAVGGAVYLGGHLANGIRRARSHLA